MKHFEFLAFLVFLTISLQSMRCQLDFEISYFNQRPSEDSRFRVYTEISLRNCLDECSRRRQCEAAGYHRLAQLCELFSKSYVTATQNVDYVTIRRDHMDGKAFNMCEINNNCIKEVSQLKLRDLAARTQFFTIRVNHNEAVAECAAYAAKLVKIDQRWKMDYIVDRIKNNPNYKGNQYWIDGTNAKADNFSASDAWRFHDNTIMPMDTYYWVPGMPDAPETDHCVRISTTHKFNDRNCSFKFSYICETI